MTPLTFVSMLLQRSLLVSAARLLRGSFEGLPARSVLERLGALPAGQRQHDEVQAWRRLVDMVRNTVCASSGHLSEDESEAMWTLYGR